MQGFEIFVSRLNSLLEKASQICYDFRQKQELRHPYYTAVEMS